MVETTNAASVVPNDFYFWRLDEFALAFDACMIGVNVLPTPSLTSHLLKSASMASLRTVP